MSTTVLDALMNAQINLQNLAKQAFIDKHPFFVIGMDQLGNAIEALENGMSPHDTLQESLFSEVKTKF